VVSFLNDASAEYPAAVVERFGNTVDIDIVTVAQKFYQTHEDAYDYLVIYNNMGIDAMAGALAYEATVRSSGTGYSVAQQDYGAEYGSAARLRSVMNMGRLDYYPADVNATVPVRAAAQDTPLTVLGHESGHLFLAFASIPDPAGSTTKPMIGYGGAHWSFVYDSEASLDEGEKITDLGSGSFVTAAVTQGFAPLDRYLMGFAPASDVADTFVALNPSVSPLGHPQSGYGFTGTRLNISVNDVIQAVGRRTPDYTVAQHRFRFGFVLVVAQ
jgi:large repetitive protein